MSDTFEQQDPSTSGEGAPVAPSSFGNTESSGAAAAAEPEYDVPGVGRVPLRELTRGYLREADYTRKRQEAAVRERELGNWAQEKQQYEQAMEGLRGFLQDRARLQAYLQTLPGEQQPQDPNEILTAGRAQELLTLREQQMQEAFKQQLAEMRSELEVNTLKTQYSEQVNGKLREIGTKYPELRSIPGMEGLLRQAVQMQQPQSLEQALSLFDQAAKYYMKTLDGLAQSRVAKVQASPLRRGIEPPNAAAPAPRGDTRDFSGVKDPRLRDAVMKDIMRIVASGSA